MLPFLPLHLYQTNEIIYGVHTVWIDRLVWRNTIENKGGNNEFTCVLCGKTDNNVFWREKNSNICINWPVQVRLR